MEESGKSCLLDLMRLLDAYAETIKSYREPDLRTITTHGEVQNVARYIQLKMRRLKLLEPTYVPTPTVMEELGLALRYSSDYLGPFFNAPLAASILDLLAEAGGRDELGKIENCMDRMDKGNKLWTHAAQAVQILKNRLTIEEQPHVLLRPSTAPAEDMLLRPAGPPQAVDPHLLRPADFEAEST